MDTLYIQQEYEKGISGRKIAEALGCSHEAVYLHIRKNDFKKHNRPDLGNYLKSDKTYQQIADETGWSISTVARFFQHNA